MPAPSFSSTEQADYQEAKELVGDNRSECAPHCAGAAACATRNATSTTSPG
jgi:hypothetical protein